VWSWPPEGAEFHNVGLDDFDEEELEEVEEVPHTGGTTEALAAAWAAAPRLRSFSFLGDLSAAGARAMAASGARLEELEIVSDVHFLDDAVAALVASPSIALRRLKFVGCTLTTSALRSIAAAAWPLEELALANCDFRGAEAGPALEALAQRHLGLRRLDIKHCFLFESGFRALVCARWPALVELSVHLWSDDEDGRGGDAHLERVATLDAAFDGLPRLEALYIACDMSRCAMQALSSQPRPALRFLNFRFLNLVRGRSAEPVTLEAVRAWAPAIEEVMCC